MSNQMTEVTAIQLLNLTDEKRYKQFIPYKDVGIVVGELVVPATPQTFNNTLLSFEVNKFVLRRTRYGVETQNLDKKLTYTVDRRHCNVCDTSNPIQTTKCRLCRHPLLMPLKIESATSPLLKRFVGRAFEALVSPMLGSEPFAINDRFVAPEIWVSFKDTADPEFDEIGFGEVFPSGNHLDDAFDDKFGRILVDFINGYYQLDCDAGTGKFQTRSWPCCKLAGTVVSVGITDGQTVIDVASDPDDENSLVISHFYPGHFKPAVTIGTRVIKGQELISLFNTKPIPTAFSSKSELIRWFKFPDQLADIHPLQHIELFIDLMKCSCKIVDGHRIWPLRWMSPKLDWSSVADIYIDWQATIEFQLVKSDSTSLIANDDYNRLHFSFA